MKQKRKGMTTEERAARRITKQLLPQFHAYLLGSVINVQWNVQTMTFNPLCQIVRCYLNAVCGNDEWAKKDVLDAMRDRRRKTIKRETQATLPSLFLTRAAYPVGVPHELKEVETNFDPALVERLKQEVITIKYKETTMEDGVEIGVATGRRPIDKEESDVNTVVFPADFNLSELTLVNYREVTGQRFRMTKEEKYTLNLNREEAFARRKKSLLGEV